MFFAVRGCKRDEKRVNRRGMSAGCLQWMTNWCLTKEYGLLGDVMRVLGVLEESERHRVGILFHFFNRKYSRPADDLPHGKQ